MQATEFIRKWGPGGPAYGWTDYTPAMPDEEILRRLLALNLERAASKQLR